MDGTLEHDAELERLRAENEDLRARNEDLAEEVSHGGRRGHGWRSGVSAVLLILGGLLLAASVLAVWASRTLLNTDRYTETVAPLIESPAVRDSVATSAVDRLLAGADIETRAREALPPRAEFLVPSLTTALRQYGVRAAEDLLASPTGQRLWVEANRRAHAAIVPALLGESQSELLSVQSGEVSIDVSQIVAQVKADLVNRGVGIVENVPNDVAGGTVVLFQSDGLAQLQVWLQALQTGAIALPILTLLVLGAAIALAPNRRRALLWLGVTAILAMVAIAGGIAWLRDSYLASTSRAVLDANAAAVFFDTLVRFLRNAIRVVAATGLVLLVGAALAGPSRAASAIRQGASGGIGSLVDATGLNMGGFSLWVERHRRALDLLGVGVIAAIVLAVEVPTPGLVIGLAVAFAVWLLLIELAARAHRTPSGTGAGSAM